MFGSQQVFWDASHLPLGTHETGREQEQCRGSREGGSDKAAGTCSYGRFSAEKVCSSLEREPEPRSHLPSAQVPWHRLQRHTGTLETKCQDAILHHRAQRDSRAQACSGAVGTQELACSFPKTCWKARKDMPALKGRDFVCSHPKSSSAALAEPLDAPRAVPRCLYFAGTMQGGQGGEGNPEHKAKATEPQPCSQQTGSKCFWGNPPASHPRPLGTVSTSPKQALGTKAPARLQHPSGPVCCRVKCSCNHEMEARTHVTLK